MKKQLIIVGIIILLVVVGLSGCVEHQSGELIFVFRPADMDPPLPGMVWAIQNNEDIYYLWYKEGGFLARGDSIKKYGPLLKEGVRAIVVGNVTTKLDIYGKPYNIITIDRIIRDFRTNDR